MYENYFGLKAKPFTIAPNPLYLYMSPQHQEALAHLVFGVQSDNGFIVITGEVGTGKTTLCRCFLEQIPKETEVSLILNPCMNAIEMLASICDELHIEYPHSEISTKIFVDLINARLLSNYAVGKKTLLIIDEAQNLSDSVLEQLRLLTNLETHDQKLLQIILIGQTELRERFEKRNLRQLAQRITARYHLTTLAEKDVMEYVRHRLVVAGGRSHLFSDAAIKKVYQHTKGVPRLINTLCDRALLGAYATNQSMVDASMVNHSLRELLGQAKTTTPVWKFWLAPVCSVIFLVALFAGIFYFVKPLREKIQVLWQQGSSHIQSLIETESSIVETDSSTIKAIPETEINAEEKNSVEAKNSIEAKNTETNTEVIEKAAVGSTTDIKVEMPTSRIENISETAIVTPKIGNFEQFAELLQSRRLMPNTGAMAWSALTQLYNVQHSSDPLHGSDSQYSNREQEGSTEQHSSIQKPLHSNVMEAENRQYRPILMERFSSAEWKGRCTALPEVSPLSCVAMQGNLNLLGVLNTPVIVPLSDGGRQIYFAVFSRMTLSQVYLSLGDQTYILPVGAFTRYWLGEFLALAPVPKNFDRILAEGAQNIEVEWVFSQLNQWQEVPAQSLDEPIHFDRGLQHFDRGLQHFDRGLQERVKLFQQAKGLVPDGLVGVHTFVLLSQVGKDFPTLHD